MSNCEFGYENCTNENKRCALCVDGLYYKAPKKIKGLQNNRLNIKTKKSNRMGSISEVKSYKQTKQALETGVTGTPNSGAGHIKGDEQIRGLLNVMIEIKTTVKKNLNKEPGKETFTIQRAWMDKLEREAQEAGMEFNYLKFSFKEHDDKFYIVAQDTQILDMIATMKHDREQLKKNNNEIEIMKRRQEYLEVKIAELEAENAYLKAIQNKDDYRI